MTQQSMKLVGSATVPVSVTTIDLYRSIRQAEKEIEDLKDQLKERQDILKADKLALQERLDDLAAGQQRMD